jgi:hypothetical protein
MSAINEYPKFKNIEDLPYTKSLKSKLKWAIENNKTEKIKEYQNRLNCWLSSKFN